MSNGPTKIDFVLDELRDIKAEQRAQGEKIYDIHGKVSKLEVKSSLFGMLGGMIMVFIAWAKSHFN